MAKLFQTSERIFAHQTAPVPPQTPGFQSPNGGWLEISAIRPIIMRMDNHIVGSQGLPQKHQLGPAVTLRSGTVVDAQVLQQKGNSLRLQIGKNIVTARLTGSREMLPKTGRFEVISAHPTPVLKLHKPSISKADSAVQALARQTLPLQRPLAHLFNAISAMRTSSPPQGTSNGPNLATFNRVAVNIEKALPDLSAVLAPMGLRNAIKRSGVFLENRLSKVGSQGISDDFKAILLRARQDTRLMLSRPSQNKTGAPNNAAEVNAHRNTALDNAATKNFNVDSLLKALDAGISKIETLQLANQVLSASGQNLIYLELPLKVNGQAESIELVIEQDGQGDNPNSEGAQSSTIYLALTIRENEQLRAKVSSTVSGISITLWSDSEQLQHLLRAHLERLRNSIAFNLRTETAISVQEFADKFLDPSKIFNNLVSENA